MILKFSTSMTMSSVSKDDLFLPSSPADSLFPSLCLCAVRLQLRVERVLRAALPCLRGQWAAVPQHQVCWSLQRFVNILYQEQETPLDVQLAKSFYKDSCWVLNPYQMPFLHALIGSHEFSFFVC